MDYNLERYPKIAKIKNFIQQGEISIYQKESDDNNNYGHLVAMTLVIKNENYIVFVDDEYEDLKKKNLLLNFVLVFRALALIADSSDYLEWCSQQNVNPNLSELLAYYKNTSSRIEKIKLLFENNTISYFISDLDFQLNSGAMQILRK